MFTNPKTSIYFRVKMQKNETFKNFMFYHLLVKNKLYFNGFLNFYGKSGSLLHPLFKK